MIFKEQEVEMNARSLAGAAAVALGIVCTGTLAFSQTEGLSQTEGPGARPGLPGWHLWGSYSTGSGRGGLAVCMDDIAKYCAGQTAGAARACLSQHSDSLSGACKAQLAPPPPNPANEVRPPCSHSPVCGERVSRAAQQLIVWQQTLGYTFSYPYQLPPSEARIYGGGISRGGVSAVDLDSKGNLWAFQRNDPGQPQLFKFGPDHKLLLAIGNDVLTYQYKPHGIKVDAQDNVWICDADGATIKKISPDGKILLTLGVRGKRGDWDEAKGQRLLWQPVMIGFGPNGDIYIFEGHANESPDDTDSGDSTNHLGAARVIHLDKNAKFINQWYGDSVGQGKFAQTHGSAVDPVTGQVWIGDREEYRIVVYDANGKFIKTIQMRNLVCALYFDRQGQLWMGSGHDGQILKIDREGNVLGAIGNGPAGTGPGGSAGPGQFEEASYLTMDSQGNLIAADTGISHITVMTPPKTQAVAH
jgi:hypothetical protein